jgi:hypothetical protein
MTVDALPADTYSLGRALGSTMDPVAIVSWEPGAVIACDLQAETAAWTQPLLRREGPLLELACPPTANCANEVLLRQSLEATTIYELQRWGQFLAEAHNSQARRVWRQLCDALAAPWLPAAMVVDDNGTMEFSWDTKQHHLDIEIPPDGEPQWFFMDRETKASEEGSFGEAMSRFTGLLRMLSGR